MAALTVRRLLRPFKDGISQDHAPEGGEDPADQA
jgi:hypothetical protein